MKRLSLVMAVLMIMLSTMGFTTVEKSYWEENKKVMEWKGIESAQDVSFTFQSPDGPNISYKMDIVSKGKIQDMITYIEINTQELAGSPKLPQIKMYTKGSNLYINKEAFLAFVQLASSNNIEISEDYVMIDSQQNVEMNATLIKELMAFLEGMDLGIDSGMVQEGNKYTINLDSDKMIDLLDAYLKYIIVNIDKLPSGLIPEQAKLTEDENKEMLDMYEAFVTPYKDTAKAAIKGSSYKQVDTFEEAKYEQEAVLDIKSPMGSGNLTMKSVSNKVEDLNISLPTSVKVITENELNEIMMPPMPPMPLMIGLDGNYESYRNDTYLEGKVEIKNINGETYLNTNQLSTALSTKIDTKDEFIKTTDLRNLGFMVEWNPESRTIDIY